MTPVLDTAPAGPSADATTVDAPVVSAMSLGKAFRLYPSARARLAEWCDRRPRHERFWALRGVSFTLPRGRCLGVIGPNGSGKSTLLKLVAGAMTPTEGSVERRGRVLSLIELGAGLNPMLTGRQNIRTLADLLAFPPGFAASRMEEIRAFADLSEFFDRPVRTYSTGMRVRLAFSMFACFRPDVFVIDEALSVGDVFFQQRCAARIRALLADGTTMMFVSHDTAAVLNLCHEAILLDRGHVAFAGDPSQAVSRYFTLVSRSDPSRPIRPGRKWEPDIPEPPAAGTTDEPHPDAQAREPARPKPGPAPRDGVGGHSAGELTLTPDHDAVLAGDITAHRHDRRHGAGGLRVIAARVTDPEGTDTLVVRVGRPLVFWVLLEAAAAIDRPRTGLRLYDRHGTHVFGAGTSQVGLRLPAMALGSRLLVRLDVTFSVRPGPYTFSLAASEPAQGPAPGPAPGPASEPVQTLGPAAGADGGSIFHDLIDGLGPIRVVAPPSGRMPFFGLARLPMRASLPEAPATPGPRRDGHADAPPDPESNATGYATPR